jgi:cytochrome c-type biogenesis protein CcmF
MPSVSLPAFGNFLLCAILICSAYAFAVSVAASPFGSRPGRPHLLPAARLGVWATAALVTVAVLVLAYAFQAHDFRIRYVSRYSDRAMPWWYLLTSLWGGQDGSLLWWTFMYCGYSSVAAFSLRKRLPELAPIILATLMSVVMFYAVLMLFSANPFATNAGGAVTDGEGLNPLLQNYWMAIHPPMLYLGMTGWVVPFAFVIAALVTGRLSDEWVKGARRFTLFAFVALAVGNTLGMLWSYEELGWGGYWAWDPVENASFMPLLAGTAFLHSSMLQERRGMFKVWNVFLMCAAFFMTIFGTFLTRSGMIASVHSFARSSIGIYFVWYMVFLAVVCTALIIWRLPMLRADNRIDALLSRDFVFLLNNWILVGMLVFVLLATTWPLISEAVRGETVTVGPGFYNKWMIPLGLILMSLTGIGPLLAWRKSTGKQLYKVLLVPGSAALLVMVLHASLGTSIGYPAIVAGDAIYDTMTGQVLAGIYAASPLFATTICAFVLVGHMQEMWRGTAVRMRNGRENALVAFVELITRAKRRYGGYIVHLGLVSMYFGFTGAAYDVDKESALKPGQSLTVRGFEARFERSRMEVDPAKRMIFTDLTLLKDGKVIDRISPAKFIYEKPQGTATTEVAIRTTLTEDVYAIMSSVSPDTKVGVFRIIVRPFVAWIWLGGVLMIFGTFVSMAPSVREVLGEARAPSKRFAGPALATAAVLVLLAIAALWLASPALASAQNDGSSSLHAGSVTMHTDIERQLFPRLLCECGGCQRLPMSGCICDWAEKRRIEIRNQLADGKTAAQIQEKWAETYGAQALAIPGDKGMDRLLWAVPMLAIAAMAVQLVRLGRRWAKQRPALANAAPAQSASVQATYDDKLDSELKRLDEDA